VDHITPLARGGHEAPYNLAPACGSCNSGKHDRLLDEWRADRLAHALGCSLAVAAEYALQRGGVLLLTT
jgi:5-methylcytosine-specific restriction endonuclease McrA